MNPGLVWVWDIPGKQESLFLSELETSDFYRKDASFLYYYKYKNSVRLRGNYHEEMDNSVA